MSRTYLMDVLANEHNWGISSNKKVPLFVGEFLITNNPQDIEPVNRENIKNLPTLKDIDLNHSFDKTNRAYHMRAGKNLVVGFDIENFEGKIFDKIGFKAPHRTDPVFLNWFANQPAHYREYSMHYGIHLLYQLNSAKLSNDALAMLAQNTEYKYKGVVNGKKLEYELMMNNHWLTFTRNTFGKVSDLSVPTPDWVYDLINSIGAKWTKPVEAKALDITKDASELAKWISALSPFKQSYVEKLRDDYSIDDFKDDDSYYEFSIALKLVFKLKQYYEYCDSGQGSGFTLTTLSNKTKGAKKRFSDISPADSIWAIAIVLKKIVPKRDKQSEYRDNLPWLVYVAEKAWVWSETKMNNDTAQDQIGKE